MDPSGSTGSSWTSNIYAFLLDLQQEPRLQEYRISIHPILLHDPIYIEYRTYFTNKISPMFKEYTEK